MSSRSSVPAAARTVLSGLLVCGLVSLTAIAGVLSTPGAATAAEPFDPEVVLPSRVDAALHRTYDGVRRAVAAIDDRKRPTARRALRASAVGFTRSHRAVMHQVAATPPPDSEEESTAAPDSVLASLNVSQASITALAGAFDGMRGPAINRLLARAIAVAQARRAELLTLIVGLDPEGAGAVFADALADTVPAYTDEVANIAEALADDRLTATARAALTAARARSATAEAQMIAAFGGGE